MSRYIIIIFIIIISMINFIVVSIMINIIIVIINNISSRIIMYRPGIFLCR